MPPFPKNVPPNLLPDVPGLRIVSVDFGVLRIEDYRGEKEKGRKVMHLRGLEFGPRQESNPFCMNFGGRPQLAAYGVSK